MDRILTNKIILKNLNKNINCNWYSMTNGRIKYYKKGDST